MRHALLLLVLIALPVFAQGPVVSPPTPLTYALLLAQRPKSIPEKQWRAIAADPANALLYPIRLTMDVLDTLDQQQLDPRYIYTVVKGTR